MNYVMIWLSPLGGLTLMLSLILFAIAIIHFYWAAGGKWMMDKVLPFESTGQKALDPSAGMTAFVGIAFLIMIGGLWLRVTQTQTFIPDWLMNYGLIFLGIIFLVRAIGDFRYAGFFKSIKDTEFAKYDSKYFSPLCLVMSGLFFTIEYLV